MSSADGPALTSGTPGTITVCAAAKAVRSCGVDRLAPPMTGMGPGCSAQMARSYHGTSNSGRGRPNTSVTMPISNADIPA